MRKLLIFQFLVYLTINKGLSQTSISSGFIELKGINNFIDIQVGETYSGLLGESKFGILPLILTQKNYFSNTIKDGIKVLNPSVNKTLKGSTAQQYEMRVFGTNGKILLEGSVHGEFCFDVSGLNHGLYFIQFSTMNKKSIFIKWQI